MTHTEILLERDRDAMLKIRIAHWIHTHGEVISDSIFDRSPYIIRVRRIKWKGSIYLITDVDAVTQYIWRVSSN